MIQHKTQAGFSLVEVLVAISILLIATVGPMTIAAQALKSAQYSREQNTAFFLAQEGIEAVILLRNEAGIAHTRNPASVSSSAWISTSVDNACIINSQGCGLSFNSVTNPTPTLVTCTTSSNNPCRLYFNANAARARYTHSSSQAVLTPYRRHIYIDRISVRYRVISEVQWQPAGNLPPQTVRLETYLHDIYNTN